MRSAVLAALSLLGACDTVFGLERDGVPIDASNGDGTKPDANRGIVSFEVMQPVNIGEMKLVKARLFDEPDTMAVWMLSATAGMIDKPLGTVKLDAIGVGDLESAWRAPNTPGPVTLHLEAVNDTVDLIVPVGMLTTWGFDNTGTKALQLSGDGVYGSRITISAGGTAASLGVWIEGANGGHLRLAIYTDVVGSPSTKLAETASVSMVDQRNDVPVTTPSALAPGNYWVMVALDTASSVRFSSATSYLAKGQPYAAGFPATFSGGFTPGPGNQIQVFATLSQ